LEMSRLRALSPAGSGSRTRAVRALTCLEARPPRPCVFRLAMPTRVGGCEAAATTAMPRAPRDGETEVHCRAVIEQQ